MYFLSASNLLGRRGVSSVRTSIAVTRDRRARDKAGDAVRLLRPCGVLLATAVLASLDQDCRIRLSAASTSCQPPITVRPYRVLVSCTELHLVRL
ncbi:hypothetical protein L227DRAFT_363321 [Lentinus tigrinus ALCF2SS1-6]|uniref:Uncharacterized protein n=1 Tax=Lentinus tigrinus ALCF2SS1-6 TaxID=1328759 RepID=A0A5C2SJN9_9APHY|nr:hypothetical protein L227DRAFT_363321 [Lentinus tigrinus ALCF2SS1-6]